MRRWIGKLLAVILLAGIVLAVAGWRHLQTSYSRSLYVDEQALIIPAGVGISWLADELVRRGATPERFSTLALAYWRGDQTKLKAGEYQLEPGMTLPELMDMVIEGRVVQRAITYIEGWTTAELLAHLASIDDIEHAIDADRLMVEMGEPERHPEGMFFPDTYFYTSGARDLNLLRQAHRRMREFLEREWANRAPDLPLDDPYQALILASIVEKETGDAAERPLIAGVFVNRLRKGMKLQTDPTVIYGMGPEFTGNLKRSDLRNDTPYNTYTRYGLPPTPIALPGGDAIRATLHPADTPALYFVARGDGTHEFSETLRDHNNAVIKYQLGGRRKSFSSFDASTQ